MFTYDFHQFISLLAIAFVTLHILVLLAEEPTLSVGVIPNIHTIHPLDDGSAVAF